MIISDKKINDIIGKKYNEHNFHCWSLVEVLIPNAPVIDFVADDNYKIAKKIKQEQQEQDNLIEVKTLEEGDFILLGRKDNIFTHVGVIYKNNLIIHNTKKDGVVIETLSKIKLKFKYFKIMKVLNDYNY